MLSDIYSLMPNMVKDDDYQWFEYFVDNRLTDALADPQPLVQERFEKGKMKAFYPYTYEMIYRHRMEEIERFANYLCHKGVTTLYIATFTYGALKLAEICRERFGMKVIGHTPVGEEVRLTKENGILCPDSGIHHNGFVGDKWSNWFAGRKLQKTDFYIREPELMQLDERDYILVMPSSRSKYKTAGHWDLDVQFLIHKGYRVKVGIWEGDLNTELYTSFVNSWAEGCRPDIIVLERFEDTLKLLKGARLVITNDSGQFHASWIMGKKVIVKLKDYFIDKWVPHGLHDASIDCIPPMQVFPSDYLELLEEAVKWSLQ